MKLTKEEKDLLASVEHDEWQRTPTFEDDKQRYESVARAALRKDKRVNIRISEQDLNRFKKKAIEEGLPYQTLMASVLHKYISGHMTG
jgi:predicted DNA binding CopG/RHH family protein